MSGIAHLSRDNKTKPARIDSVDADKMNSIIERISGVNPTVLAEGGKSKGGRAQSPNLAGAPPSPIVQNFAQPQSESQHIQMLEQRLAKYEGSAGDPAFSSTVNSNRGSESRVWRRDMDPKKAKKKDLVDGEPDSKKSNQPQGQAMATEQMNILGISMNEWRDLAGLTTPYAIPGEVAEVAPVLAESNESTEDYFTEDELAEAWFSFISNKGYDPGEFAEFAETAEAYGDESAILAIQDLEDEFQEQVDAFIESQMASDGNDLSEEEIQDFWVAWLEDKGISVEMFNHMIDEAIATEDQDEMDSLLAVEEMFYSYLESRLADMSRIGVIKTMRGSAGKDITHLLRGKGAKKKKLPSATMIGSPRGGVRRVNESAESERSAGESPSMKGFRSLVRGKGKKTIQFGDKKPTEIKSLAGRKVKPSKKGSFGLPRGLRRKMGMDTTEDISVDEDGLSFECGSDDGGGPSIPWARVMKAYKLKGNKKSGKSKGGY